MTFRRRRRLGMGVRPPLPTIEFLLHLLRVAGERLLMIWDGSPIHRRAAVKEFVASTRSRVWLEALPGYAPDLNPWDEGGWHHLKNVEMRNLVCRDLDELHQELEPGHQAPAAEASSGPFLLCTGQVEAQGDFKPSFRSGQQERVLAFLVRNSGDGKRHDCRSIPSTERMGPYRGPSRNKKLSHGPDRPAMADPPRPPASRRPALWWCTLLTPAALAGC